MSSTYTKINWQDYPSKQTPINAENLNHMDDQIKDNADDIKDIKDDITEIQGVDADLQQQIDQKTIDGINVVWTNNMLTPEQTLKQIGRYNDDYEHYSFNIDASISSGISQAEFSVPMVPGYGSDIRITGITGVILDGNRNAYPVNYSVGDKYFYVYYDATYKNIVCSWNNITGTQSIQCKILLTVTYANIDG